MEELKILLENFWVTKDDTEMFNRIRDNEKKLRSFVEDKLGYRLIVNPFLIKLEKIPGDAEKWMGIEEFQSSMDYAFLCLLLAFLEDMGIGDQFILSNITEYIEMQYEGMESVDWTLFKHRKSLVRVLNFAEKMKMIKVDDGEHERFADSRDVEVLYENTGLSRYFMRIMSSEINEEMTLEDFIKDDRYEDNKVLERRHRVYRKLLLSPAVYYEGTDDQDFIYIKNYRNTIEKDFDDYLDAQLHIHKTSAYIIFDENKYASSYFPDNKNISDIVLQIAYVLRDMMDSGSLNVGIDDHIEITEGQFMNIVSYVKSRFKSGWSKIYTDMSDEKLFDEIIEFMKSWKMAIYNEDTHSYTLMPILGKFIGEYRNDFKGAIQNE
ncbi:TIGR02678 family protein [Thermoanaerobacterium thermosulfurigenes]|uniref:TIGR02678 family protein n=1 Tax=Thermoanaerobacterium thermosulfurigenes TaxID=33950 RepID=UPI003EF8CAAC